MPRRGPSLGAFRLYLLVVVLLGTVLFAALRYAGGRTPLGIGVLVVIEIAAILTALAFSVREFAER
jgi:hypothetical protein